MTQAQRREATQAALISAGRRLFATLGYDAVAAEQVVVEAGVTRGALYLNFDGKAGLFVAVFLQIEAELVQEFPLEDFLAGDALGALRSGVGKFLELSLRAEVQQIALIDAPAVLGWDQWRAVGVKYGLGVIEGMLAHAIAEGVIPEQPLRPTAHVLLGALDEAALYVSRAADPDQARREMDAVCDRLINGIAGQ
jgi:AcrR family transcriptional regulator